MFKLTLYVIGICCFDSFKLLEQEIQRFGGINSIKASIPKGKIIIEFKPSLVSSMEIANKIESQGFPIVKKVQNEYCYGIYN